MLASVMLMLSPLFCTICKAALICKNAKIPILIKLALNNVNRALLKFIPVISSV